MGAHTRPRVVAPVAELVLDVLAAEACQVPKSWLYARLEEIRGTRSDSTKRAVDRLIAAGEIRAHVSLWHETRYSLPRKAKP